MFESKKFSFRSYFGEIQTWSSYAVRIILHWTKVYEVKFRILYKKKSLKCQLEETGKRRVGEKYRGKHHSRFRLRKQFQLDKQGETYETNWFYYSLMLCCTDVALLVIIMFPPIRDVTYWFCSCYLRIPLWGWIFRTRIGH